MTLTERLYRVLLRLYPRRFRLEYADEMTQLFLDQLRDAREGRASRGLVATWLATFADLGRSSVDERLHGDRDVGHSVGDPPSAIDRVLGMVGVAGGVALLAAMVIFIPATFNVGRLVLLSLGPVAVAIGAYRRLGERDQRPSLPIVTLVAVIGLAFGAGTLFVGIFEHPFAGLRGVVYAWLSIAFWVSHGLFAAVAWRLGGWARVATVALVLGAAAFLGIDRLWEPTALMQQVAHVAIAANGFGWILLGLVVARRPRRLSTPVEARGAD